MSRATSPVVGVALLLAVTVTAATAVGTVAVSLDAPSATPSASLSLTADADANRLQFRHRGGQTVDTRSLRLVVTVDGERLDHQPSIPFFAQKGFQSGPTGPFNTATSPRWEAGERAGFEIAATNAPRLDSGDRVTVDVFRQEMRVVTLRATAG